MPDRRTCRIEPELLIGITLKKLFGSNSLADSEIDLMDVYDIEFVYTDFLSALVGLCFHIHSSLLIKIQFD